jgi:dTDP-6-deoxy-L-talose 4-dehydrogenase (NAD+)
LPLSLTSDPKTILMTGATGFVGRQIARVLAARGHALHLVVRDPTLRAHLPANAKLVTTPDLFVETDKWWLKQLDGIDTVIHAAWYVEPGLYLDSRLNIDCASGAARLAELAQEAGIRHFIGIGTCFEYQLPNADITVQSTLAPVTLYAAAKLATYFMLRRRFAVSGTDFSWARIFYLFGEGEHPARLFPTLHRKLAAGETVHLSSPDKIRDFLDVRIAGNMIAGLVETRQTGVLNICSGKPVTLRAFAEKVADLYGRRDLLEFGSAPVHPRDPQAVVGICNVLPANF